MEKKKLRFAVAGCGYMGKRHAAMVQNNSDCELVALCDTRPEIEMEISEFNVPYFNDLDSMLNKGPEFDVLCIATPNGLHEEQAILGLRAGKHIVLEKPMALTKTGCERIIDESLRQHKQVFCVMQNRYSPPSAWLKEIISKNILGEIFIVQINCYWNRDERYYVKDNNWHGTKELDGGSLFTQFSHFIDTMFWLFGDIENIKTNIKTFNHKHLTEFEDSGNIIFDFVDGGSGVLNFSTSVWNRNLESSLTIIAENGTIKIAGQYMDEVEYCHVRDYNMPELISRIPFKGNDMYQGAEANHYFIFEKAVKVLNHPEQMITDALEGLKVVDIIERIYKAGVSNEHNKQEEAGIPTSNQIK